ncbi:MAG: V-type ATP synthase subunit E [Candidatus Marsarchaeota archaeon]|jgi:vacuolar-type H+-ATPase subunit E/Vma4|nr:V-type ATP synthase subunit E [Candidatus Marsarchaeota archaeon]
MGLEEIVAEINKRKELEVSKIISEARSEANRIIAEANAKSSEDSKGIISKAELEASQSRAREQSKANIEAKRILYESLSNKLAEAEALLQGNLSEYKATDGYKALLLKLYSNATEALGKDSRIYVAEEDMSIIKKKFPKAKLNAAHEGFSFGLYAESADGKMTMDYGIESIIARSKEGFYSRLIKAINGKND